MATSKSAKKSPDTFDSPRRGMGVPLVGSTDGEDVGPDEPETPPMPGPQGGPRGNTGGTCSTCSSVPFNGAMTISLMGAFLFLLSIGMLLATSIMGTQQFYLDELSSAQNAHAQVQVNK
jgi:hypothetical protein